MLSYIIRRLLLIIPTMIGMTLMTFFIMKLSPGDVSAMLQAQTGEMRPEQRQEIEAYIKARYGLDDPLIVQYLRWLNHISPVGVKEVGEGFPASVEFGFKSPDLGKSWPRQRQVSAIIAETLPITILLNLITIPIIYIVSITAGIYAAKHRGKLFDVASGTTFLALYSMPSIWVGVMLLGLFASRDYLQWFPTGGLHSTMAESMAFFPRWGEAGFQRGWLLDFAWHLALPVICLTYGGFAFLSKLMRASVLENLSADFARTARAKGLAERVVLFRHVVSNSVLPLITVAAGILPSLLGGTLIIENIFSINGMGRLMIEAIKMKDQELVLSVSCVAALIGLVSLVIADVCYALADPRVTYE